MSDEPNYEVKIAVDPDMPLDFRMVAMSKAAESTVQNMAEAAGRVGHNVRWETLTFHVQPSATEIGQDVWVWRARTEPKA